MAQSPENEQQDAVTSTAEAAATKDEKEEEETNQEKEDTPTSTTAPKDEAAAAAAATIGSELPNDHEGGGEEEEEEEEESILLHDLVILPPEQKRKSTASNSTGKDKQQQAAERQAEEQFALQLPPLRAEEPVQSLRGALLEVVGFAHYTNYRFEVEQPSSAAAAAGDAAKKLEQQKDAGTTSATGSGGTTATTAGATSVVSPYTGMDAVISIPVQVKSLHSKQQQQEQDGSNDNDGDEKKDKGNATPATTGAGVAALDEFGDLRGLVRAGLLESSCSFRIVLETYHAAAVKDHVQRFQNLMEGNAPAVTSFVGGGDGDDAIEDVDNDSGERQTAESPSSQHEGHDHDAGGGRSSDNNKNNSKSGGSRKNGEQQHRAKKESDGGKGTSSAATALLPPLPALPAVTESSTTSANLADYFYVLACEDPSQYTDQYGNINIDNATGIDLNNNTSENNVKNKPNGGGGGKSSKKKNRNKNNNNKSQHQHQQQQQQAQQPQAVVSASALSTASSLSPEQYIAQWMQELQSLEDAMYLAKDVQVMYSPFHPPSPTRKYMGHIAYLQVTVQQDQNGGSGGQDEPAAAGALHYHVTAMTMGFYINKTQYDGRHSAKHPSVVFDPSPRSKDDHPDDDRGGGGGAADGPCFSHSLLDCVLQASPVFATKWRSALQASAERARILTELQVLQQQQQQQQTVHHQPAGAEKSDTNASTTANNVAAEAAAGSLVMSSPLFRTNLQGDFAVRRTRGPAATSSPAAAPPLETAGMAPPPSWIHGRPRSAPWNFVDTYQQPHPLGSQQVAWGDTAGVDVRTGAVRDWNEEIQLAREMPGGTAAERADRARLLYKVQAEFAEAAALGVQAICDGHLLPMNPTEPAVRSHVYLHNNIFFSRAVDAGPETFKISVGDAAARKSANRDVQCLRILQPLLEQQQQRQQQQQQQQQQQLEQEQGSSSKENRKNDDKSPTVMNMCTLGTVLIDMLGTRFVCQSILPGILIGEKSHSILYGAVESGTPLASDADFLSAMEHVLSPNNSTSHPGISGGGGSSAFGGGGGGGDPVMLMVAPRPLLALPLTQERMEQVEQLKRELLQQQQQQYNNLTGTTNSGTVVTTAAMLAGANDENGNNDGDDKKNKMIADVCIPMEAKGILGSDQRTYVLDFGRVTPRDANWIPADEGGTGKWEEESQRQQQNHGGSSSTNSSSNHHHGSIPSLAADKDEWTLCVLRPELISTYSQFQMANYMRQQKKNNSSNGQTKAAAAAAASGGKDAKEEAAKTDAKTSDKEDSETPATETKATSEDSTNKTGASESESDSATKDEDSKRKETSTSEKEEEEEDNNNNATNSSKGKLSQKQRQEQEDKEEEQHLEYLKSLRFNVNVFLPHMRSLEGIDAKAHEQVLQDEKCARQAALFLWNEVLPKITKVMKEAGNLATAGAAVHYYPAGGPLVHAQIPANGVALTEFLHSNGVNCRYLGRLAVLAKQQEDVDNKATAELKKYQQQKSSHAALPAAGVTLFAVEHRRCMPQCWLDLLEVEMVARAARHVLDRYMVERGGVVTRQPAQTVASFLCAIVSDSEETAAQTETRLQKAAASGNSADRDQEIPDEDDFEALSVFGMGAHGDAVPPAVRSRNEVWKDLEDEIARRFRYQLTIFNSNHGTGTTTKNTNTAAARERARGLYLPLLRRVCQRTGIRLFAKDYAVGGKCLTAAGTTAGGRFTASYPLTPLDIADIVPLMKHAAAHADGFVECTTSSHNGCGGGAPQPALVGLPPLQVSFADARMALDRAHLIMQSSSHHNHHQQQQQVAAAAAAAAAADGNTDNSKEQAARNQHQQQQHHHHLRALQLPKGLELAQEAASLYQRVTENPAHPAVVECMQVMALIFLEAGDAVLAVSNATKALACAVQCTGLDSHLTLSLHLHLFSMCFGARQTSRAVQHLRAALYILHCTAGPRHTELFTSFYKLASVYSNAEYRGRYLPQALQFFQQAARSPACDRIMQHGITARNSAKILEGLGQYKAAMEMELQAYRTLSFFLGKEHPLTVESDSELQRYTKLAVQQGKKHGGGSLVAATAAATSTAATTTTAINDYEMLTAAAVRADAMAADLINAAIKAEQQQQQQQQQEQEANHAKNKSKSGNSKGHSKKKNKK